MPSLGKPVMDAQSQLKRSGSAWGSSSLKAKMATSRSTTPQSQRSVADSIAMESPARGASANLTHLSPAGPSPARATPAIPKSREIDIHGVDGLTGGANKSRSSSRHSSPSAQLPQGRSPAQQLDHAERLARIATGTSSDLREAAGLGESSAAPDMDSIIDMPLGAGTPPRRGTAPAPPAADTLGSSPAAGPASVPPPGLGASAGTDAQRSEDAEHIQNLSDMVKTLQSELI